MTQVSKNDGGTELRESGIVSLGAIPWGTHLCQFYETSEELLSVIIPFLKAGLENNEYCVWLVARPLTIEDAIAAIRNAIENFDAHLIQKDIEILPLDEWYRTDDGRFDGEKGSKRWRKKTDEAVAAGYSGLRGTGDLSWAQAEQWENVITYEKRVMDYIHDRKIVLLCTFQLSTIDPAGAFDIAHSHHPVMLKGAGDWEVLEKSDVRKLQADLTRRNYQLEQKVAERTKQLESTVTELRREITEKVKITEEFQRSESRYRTLIEQASDAIIITDQTGVLIEVNSSFCAMVGYTEAELIGKNVKNLLPPSDLAADPLRFDLLLTGQSLFRERKIMRKNGAIFPIEEHVKMLEDKRIIAILRDITDRRRIEEALRQSEDRVKLIIDTIPATAWSAEPDGVLDYANKRWLEYAGEKAFEDPQSVIHPDDFLELQQTWQQKHLDGEPFDDEMRLRGIDGKYRWFLVRTAPFRNERGEIIKWYGVSIDIEDSRQARDELRLAYQRLSYHVENTPLAVIEWDRDLNVKHWSARAEAIFGWSMQEAIGKNAFDPQFNLVYEDDREAVSMISKELINGLVNRNLTIARYNTKDHKVIYCECYNSVLRDEHGNIITILCFVHDVTARVNADANLKQSYGQIRLLTEHLQKVREEERIHIAREVHDELGGQLTALKMDISWLNQKLSKEDKAITIRIKNAVNIAEAMLKSVRRISSQLRPSLLDNLGLVAAIEWHLKEFEDRFGIKAQFKKPREEFEISDTIKTGLFRVFQESLTNVARHSGSKNVQIELLKNDEQLILSIVDDGHGFDQHAAETGKTLGILGMKERTAMLGGEYDISSSVGKGTRVTVVLPIKSQNYLK
jgi:PAS domain S-box-containing protein